MVNEATVKRAVELDVIRPVISSAHREVCEREPYSCRSNVYIRSRYDYRRNQADGG